MKKLVFFILVAALFCGTYNTVAQELRIQVKGVVTAEYDGEPLVGVTVLVKGINVGTATNLDGKYIIIAPRNSALVFSMIGYETQEIIVTGESPIINVIMQEDCICYP